MPTTDDGFQALAHIEAGAAHLVSRNRNAFKSFPDLCATMAACIEAERALLDGEIVYLGADGRPEFYNLMRRRTPQHFYAFDILWLDGKDLRRVPLVKRKQILRRVVPRIQVTGAYTLRSCARCSIVVKLW